MKASDLAPRYDVAVIGAGPAGLAAASLTARAGLTTLLIDENPGIGGQIYRGIGSTPVAVQATLGADYWAGSTLADELASSGAVIATGTTVWSLDAERRIGVSMAGEARMIEARYVVLATGALERPFAIPGWTLPGVMTIGGAQTLLKAHGLVPEGRVVLAGCGPLLWLYAAQLLRAGGAIDAIIDTTPRGNWLKAALWAPSFALSRYFGKGLALMREVRRKTRLFRAEWLEAIGDTNKLTEVAFGTAGQERRLPADRLLLHHGVVPNLNLAAAAGIAPAWDARQHCWVVPAGDKFAALTSGIAVAGDAAGIGGAEAAAERGRLAALAIVEVLRPAAMPSLPRERSVRRALRRALRGRRFLDALFLPAPQFRRPMGDTMVCRCEEVTAEQIRGAANLGVPGPNQMKAFLRCGMGPCQGRMCGLTVTELIAAERGIHPRDVGYWRLRPPVKPITLGELASLPVSEAERVAVER
jgi:NADPH-dependent 2,4-dienoyl-CoA reductase/sulfur reductase-like enzyme